MAPRYRVTLNKEERKDLEAISTKGKRAARTVLYARALLLPDAGGHGPKWLVAKVAEALGTTSRSLEKLKKRFVEEGLPAAIERKRRETPPREVKFGGDFEAKPIALACSEAPKGRLPAEKPVELDIVPSVSPATVCSTLKKTNLSPISAGAGKFRRTGTRPS